MLRVVVRCSIGMTCGGMRMGRRCWRWTGVSFPHLHVSSAYSTDYGVTLPQTLTEQVRAQGGDFLAITDRDGLYGAIKHFRACITAVIRAGLGAELTVIHGFPALHGGVLDEMPESCTPAICGRDSAVLLPCIWAE